MFCYTGRCVFKQQQTARLYMWARIERADKKGWKNEKKDVQPKSRRKMKPQVFVVRWGAGSIRAAIKRQRMDRAPRGKVWWLYGTTGRQTGTEMQDRESRRGRDLETQERGRESKGQKGEWLTIAHLCRQVNADTDTKYRLSKSCQILDTNCLLVCSLFVNLPEYFSRNVWEEAQHIKEM